MKFSCGKTQKALEQWHDWFAWYPVEVNGLGDLETDCRWLETVERKMVFCSYVGSSFRYRSKR